MSLLLDPHLDLSSQILEIPGGKLIPMTEGGVDLREYVQKWNEASPDRRRADIIDVGRYISNSVRMMQYRSGFAVYLLLGEEGVFSGAADIMLDGHPANISLWLERDIQRQGYGTMVYARMIEWVQAYTRIKTLAHVCDDENIASRALAGKFGGVFRGREKGRDVYHIPV